MAQEKPQTPPTKKLRIFRLVDGVRVPFTMELDSQLTVISETVDQAAYRRVVYGREAEKATRTMTAWATLEMENPLPGTEALRAQYQADLKKLHSAADADNRPCRPCDVGTLISRYRTKLEEGKWL